MELGPQSSTDHIISESLRIHMQNCESYVSSKLSSFDKYIVWRYTVGSASVNNFLITGKISDNSIFWTYLFFQYWGNTVKKLSDLTESNFYDYDLPNDFGLFFDYFKNPDYYLESNFNITEQILKLYILNLQRIILNSPEVLGEGFDLYKISTKYPGLPEINDLQNFRRTQIKQSPFNSTTFSKELNFAPFISPTIDGVLFVIHVPKNSRVLYIPDLYHAYTFEHEFILPKDCTFDIYDYNIGKLNYIDPSTVNINLLQPKNNISMGSVYELNETLPCGNKKCQILTKTFNILECNYIPPK
jgi:hypothetical protein